VGVGVSSSRIWKRGVALAAFWMIAAGILVIYARRPVNDYKVYIASGEAVLQRKDIYQAPLPLLNTGPPFFSLFCVGPALLDRVSPTFGRAVWIGVNLAVLLLLLDLCSRLVHGRTLRLASAPLLVPLILTLPYLFPNFLYLQVNLIVFALTLAGLKLQEEGKELRGGLLVGAGAALKVMPILFVPYLFYRRRWIAGSAALAAAALLTLSPGLVLGWDLLGSDLRYWWTLISNNPVWDAGFRNQSVLAMWDRVLGHRLVPIVSPGVIYLEMSHSPAVRTAWQATVGITGFLMLLAFRGRPQRGSVGSVLEWSAIFVISAIFGPVGWRHYLVVLLLPNVLLYAIARSALDRRAQRVATAILWGCFLVSVSSAHQLGHSLSARLGMASNLTLAALAMIAGLLWLRRWTPDVPSPAPLAPLPETGETAERSLWGELKRLVVGDRAESGKPKAPIQPHYESS
jgi:hypothetical protein